MIQHASITSPGERPRNEDAVSAFQNIRTSTYAYVLADGLGGHGNGDIASNFVADCVGAAIENMDSSGETFIDQCFDTAQNLLMEEKDRSGYTSIKTTMVLLLITGNEATWGHIGDSRLYHFRNGKLLGRTLDHSVPQMLVITGQIKEKDIRHHPARSTLLRAMGAEWDNPEYEIDARHVRLEKGDSFLLCSDGFWEWIDEKKMQKILKKDISPYDTLRTMEAEVKLKGRGKNMDNYSAILVTVK